MRILVTGAAGFIGSNLTARLLAAGHEVLGIDNFFLGKRAYVEPFLAHPQYRFLELDLLERELLATALVDFLPQRVWHLAANSDISLGTKYTDFDLRGGTLATYSLLEAMRSSGCGELVFSSSGAVYGEPSVHPTPEDYGPLLPISLYAASKLACEGLISAFAHNFDVRTWFFRFGNVVGPNPTHGVIHDFVLRLLEDPSQLKILGDGAQAKPYVHVDDCLDGMLYGCERSHDLVNFFNLAVPDRTTVRQIATWTLELMGIRPDSCAVEYTGGARGWRGDVPFVNLDVTKLKALGWEPRLRSDEAVRRAIREIVDQSTGRTTSGTLRTRP